MEVILNQDVPKLGKAGTVVKVKDGFARNFLLPNKLAVPVTPANMKMLEEKRIKKERELAKLKQDSEALKQRLDGLSITITASTNEEEKLYGSITQQDIISALKDEGIELDKSMVILDEPIKSLGIYNIPIKLYPDVIAHLKVWVVKK
ncbi:MAG: 50S ribosomal protein L9 [Candidatus Omnitrophica bacterium]|nr:50S ribosomal protein L9 [Candidatus Omnitrophota bacterium]